MKAIIFLISIILALNSAQAKNDKAQLYYLVDQPLDAQETELAAIEANQEAIPVNVINCIQNKNKCLKFKNQPQYPQLVFWNGPGSGFKLLGEATSANLNGFFEKRNANPLKPIQDFLLELTLIQFLGMSGGIIVVLHSVFSVIFKDRSGLGKAKTA